ncbi:transient receptor potential cation channel subfamily A member 1-like [Pocillopora damicornis]|uniref:transient receptor potential cation channel subfamily A member 1-like n=1 Tax=Pocillopora damicornis TaxID=46731 RepID=UPI000F552F83|nr:transient receptor potential cation channel subfamily A member 1-like [Pocillopora damicornis]
MAASPGSMYQKQVLKKRPTSYLQSSLGSLSKSDRYKERDIPLNSNPPGSPEIQRSNISLRKFSQISAHSDASEADENHADTNGNSTKQTGTPKNAIRAKHHQKAGKGNKIQKLHHAALSGNEAEVQKLLGKGVDINAPDSVGKTPLHNAILGKHFNIVDLLLKSGADVKCLDERGDTPLHAAVRVDSEAIVVLLLKDGKTNTNAKGFGSYTPLHIAAQMDCVDICKRLVEHEGDIAQAAEDKMTPFGFAIAKGAQAVSEYFAGIVKEKDMNLEGLLYNVDNEGSTLLHLAVDSGILPIVGLCLKLGSNVRQTKESDNSTALHLACSQGSLEIVQLLTNEIRDICKEEIIDEQGMFPIHRAAMNNHFTVVNFLLDQGAEADPRDIEGQTPLFLAASVGGTETVQLLMDRGADITLKDMELRSALHVAIGNTSTMDVLMKSPSSKSLVVDKDATGYTPVHYAARAGCLEHIILFISKNKAAEQVTSDSLDTPLHIVSRYGWLEIAQRLLKKRNVRIINVQNNQGKTPLHLACHEGHEKIAKLLLMEGATIERDHHDRTPLHLAATKGSEECVEYILETHPGSLNAIDKYQNTALNLAATAGHASLVTYLLSVKEQEILLNSQNQNVLDLAISNDKEAVAMAIIEHPRWKEVMDSAVGGGVSQIQTLVEKMPEVAERVLDQCVDQEGDPSSKDFKVTYDLRLIQGKQNSLTSSLEHSLDALKTMAERRRENCLTHPVCYVLMNIKWKKFGWITFIVNLSLYLAFLLPFTALAVYLKANSLELCGYKFENMTKHRTGYYEHTWDWHDDDSITCNGSQKTVVVLHYVVIVFALIHLTKEIVQIMRQRLKYWTAITNYIEWVIYVSALVFVFPICACKAHYKSEAAAFSLFFAWLNLVLYFRRLSYYGKYVIMLLTMFKTLFQVLLLFFLFVVAFGTTFYLLMYNKSNFDTLEYALMKTFAMTLGELNYESDFIPDIKLHYPLASNVMFVFFSLAMPIILMNMLIGLAVGDIDKIQQKSVMDRYVMQVELLLELEESLPQWILKRMQIDKYEEFPNRKSKLQTRLYEKIIGFGKAESKGEDDGVPPAMAQIIDRVMEQDAK